MRSLGEARAKVRRCCLGTMVQNSLRRPQADCIDLYQIHRLDHDTDIVETVSARAKNVASCEDEGLGSC